MALRGIKEYIAQDANNIARVEYSCIPRKRAIQYYYYYLCRALFVIYLTVMYDCKLPFFCLQTARTECAHA